MWRRFKKNVTHQNRSGLSINDAHIAFARVQRKKNGGIQLAAATIDNEVNEENWTRRLVNDTDGIDLTRSRVTSVLRDGSYQLLLVEVPNVPADEVKSAVRWQIKDLLDFPVDDAIVEMFEMPEQSTAGQKSMAYVVATQRNSVQEHIELVQGAGLSLDVIDIPELCARNIAILLPQDNDGVAFLHFTNDHGILTVTRQGVLYLIRRIEVGRVAMNAVSADNFAKSELIATIVLETQRSLHYYESHFDRRPVRELVLAPGSDMGGLAEALNEQLGVTVSSLDFNELFEMQSVVSPDIQAECLLAVGAALRTEALAA